MMPSFVPLAPSLVRAPAATSVLSRSSAFLAPSVAPTMYLPAVAALSFAAAPLRMAAPTGQERIKVGVLGCTGSVGQRFITLLAGHPWFEVSALGASSRSAGKAYSEAVNWKQATPIPAAMSKIVVSECAPGTAFEGVQIVFSGLDADFAGEIEDQFAAAGVAVFSNAKNHRMDADVPILIPPVNADHLDIIPAQQRARGFSGEGFIVTNANCSTTALAIGLKPIADKFGIDTMIVSTMQAISGAGYPGLSSMDILDNVVPYIGGEEPKMETESKKIFGSIQDGVFVNADFRISAMCNRVHVLDGHTECVSIKLVNKATPSQVIDAIRSYPSVTRSLDLPSSPDFDILYHSAPDRPQPRMDRGVGNGFTVTVGRVRECNVFDLRMVVFGHNTIIGAAGGSILNAELCVKKNLINAKVFAKML
jgi:aspartate-semialdehyde dehydrogenase